MPVDLFGNEIEESELLRDKFIEPPFSVLDTKRGEWQGRKRKWASLGIKSEIGRDAKSFNTKGNFAGKEIKSSNTSIFDPALTEVLYHWFCPDDGYILDPFAGGSVRGIVAHYLGYKYTGIELRPEQVESNRDQAKEIFGNSNEPHWITGDSLIELDNIQESFDFVFSCPPYANLEVYSELEGDISNMDYNSFLSAYRLIISKACDKLISGGHACFVVGEVRNKDGNYIGFVPDTVNAFKDCGMDYYNEAILLNPIGTAMMRANGNMKSKKLVKVHQNVLVFKKP